MEGHSNVENNAAEQPPKSIMPVLYPGCHELAIPTLDRAADVP
jgi:hypothetical protein